MNMIIESINMVWRRGIRSGVGVAVDGVEGEGVAGLGLAPAPLHPHVQSHAGLARAQNSLLPPPEFSRSPFPVASLSEASSDFSSSQNPDASEEEASPQPPEASPQPPEASPTPDPEDTDFTTSDALFATPIVKLPNPSRPFVDSLKPSKDAIQWSQTPFKFTQKLFAKRTPTPEIAEQLAANLVAYFTRPLEGFYTETIYHPNTEPIDRIVPFEVKLPVLAEFAVMHGMTEKELKKLADLFPDSLGRALELAKDVMKTNLIRGGLSDKMPAQAMKFVATNETDMRDKTEHVQKNVNLNELLDQIEESNKQYANND